MLYNLLKNLDNKIKLLFFITLCTNNVFAAEVTNLVKPVYYYVNHYNELQEITTTLKKHGKMSLVGISGIGKTQLARQYADLNRNKYDTIWFFDGNADIKQQFVELAREINKKSEINKKAKIAEGITEAKNAVLSYLNENNNFLIVLDNLKINNNATVSEFLEWENDGHILYCSQDSEALPHILKISYLSINSSEELIRNIIPNFSKSYIIKLANKLNGYPITISNSAIFLKANNYITYDEYEKYLDKSDNYMETYVTVLSKQLSKSALDLLNQLVFFNNQSISKSLINKIANVDSFVEDLVSLNRYQIVSPKGNDNDFPVFEMHDKLKDSVIASMHELDLRMNLTAVLDKVNAFIPKGKNIKQELVLLDDTLIMNLEALLINSEKYKIDEIKILELKKNLMSFYLGMGVTRCNDLKSWFLDKKEKFLAISAANKSKALAAEFLILIGVYDYFINADHISAIEILHSAEGVIEKLDGYEELRYMVYSQLAQAYVYSAEMEKIQLYINKAKSIDLKKIGIEFEGTLLQYIESKYYLSLGDYKSALLAIDNFIEIIKDHQIDYYFAPIYVMKSTILNYLEEYNSAYEIVKAIYDREINEISKGNAGGIRLRVIIELSRAELGRGNKEQAVKYAEQAINIYEADTSRNNNDLSKSIDTDLADSFIVYADIQASLGKYSEAVNYYSIAENIYYNKYEDKVSSLYEVRLLYYKAIRASDNAHDKYSLHKFQKRLTEKFEINHYKDEQMLKEE